MREIKFRAWDGEKMWTDGSSTVSYILEKSVDGGMLIAFEKNVLMQYTGLKDKNGKEIYEGDVITTVPEVFKKYGEGLDRTELYEVIYAENFYGWLPFVYHGGNEPSLEDCEIIGNIYFNPELLTPPKGTK